MNSSGERRSLRRYSCNIVWRTFCPGWGSRNVTTFGLRVELRNDLAEPAFPFCGGEPKAADDLSHSVGERRTPWRTTSCGSTSGATGIQRTATSRRLLRTLVQAMLFVLGAK